MKTNLISNLSLVILACCSHAQRNNEQIREVEQKFIEVHAKAEKMYLAGDFKESRLASLKVLEYAKHMDSLGAKLEIRTYCVQWERIAYCDIKLKNLHLALDSFRKSIVWIDGPKTSNIIGSSSVLSAYAVALARSNKLNEAKICYYASLNYLRTTNQYNEPSPFLVVFDPDPKAEVWKLNKENLIKAAMCINAMENGFYREEFFEKYADWDYAMQIKNAKFPGEKFNQENDPNVMRKDLQVLIKAEEDLKTNWPKICEKYVDPLQNR